MTRRRWWPAGSRLVVLVAVLALVVAAAGYVWGREVHRTTGCAEMPDAIGLYPGSNLTLRGVKIGSVTSVRPAGGHVRVGFEMDSSVRLPADVSAVTTSDSIVTDRRLDFPISYVGGPRWDTARCIPLGRNRTPKSLSATFSAFDTFATQLTSDRNPGGATVIGDTISTVDKGLAGTATDFNRAVKGLSAALGDPAQRDDQLMSLVRNGARLSGFFVENWGDVQSAIDQLGNFGTSLGDITRALNPSIVQITEVLPKLIDSIKRYRPYLTGLLDLVVPLAQSLPTDKVVGFVRMLPGITAAMNAIAADPRSGLSVQVVAPRVRVPVAAPAAACVVINTLAPASCRVSPGSPAVDTSLVALLLRSVGR
ncbi:MlaD family protein [Williamsia sp. CHRR-6]|uniref:MlaD family protein n=1 Tax=Williamsia sp. CHRR-6 TaxID=2835871 RepID=UPI001BDAC65B|nr:MlaD family protein [Williamsia sp. CHRR-6]MBT0566575.1 MCE family protein [Williamsia sp. CHRR-6]